VTPVCLEVGEKKVFASALDWPGWCRSGRDEPAALAALAAAAPRYAVAARSAGVRFAVKLAEEFEVIERLPGSMPTDFGVPMAIAEYDRQPLSKTEAGRLARLVLACWTVFDDVVAAAPAELRKGPRGGGRDRDKIVEHVLGADSGYASKLGLRLKVPAYADTAAVAAFREPIAAALHAAAPAQPQLKGPWPPRYAARRIAWHALDHAWEIEDKSSP
jgi:hypothetical protein